MINRISLGKFGKNKEYEVFKGLCDSKNARCSHCYEILCKKGVEAKSNILCIEIVHGGKIAKRIGWNCLENSYKGLIQAVVDEYDQKNFRMHQYFVQQAIKQRKGKK